MFIVPPRTFSVVIHIKTNPPVSTDFSTKDILKNEISKLGG
jgi:hypothetical protein